MGNLGDLTTTFTAPTSCATESGIYRISYSGTSSYWGLGPFDTSCMPSNYSPQTTNYYSPAWNCPSGYTTACLATVDSEIIATCCPTAYQMECFTDGVVYPWQRTLGCTKPETTAWTATSVMYANQFTTTVVAVTEETGSGAGFGAWGVQIRYRSEDISATATSATSSVATQTQSSTLSTTVSSSTASIASTTPTNGSSTSTSDGGDDKSSESLSSAASAGIGIGCGGAILIITATLWYVLRLRRRLAQASIAGAKQRTPTPTSENSPQGYVYDPFSSEHDDLAPSPQMLGPSNFPAEMSGTPYHQRRAELSGHQW